MKKTVSFMNLWEIALLSALLLYFVACFFLLKLVYLAIAFAFIFGGIACVYAVQAKRYLRAMVYIIVAFLMLFSVMLMPW